ncbi:MAG: hypothetical protein AB9922_01330 [Bacteroidales bacterium]
MLLIITALLPVGAYLALQMPALQTWTARKAAGSLSERLKTEVSIGKVYYVFFNKLIIKDIAILYPEKDTLFNCEKISLSLSPREIIDGKLHFGKLHLYNGIFNLVNINDTTTNIAAFFSQISGKKDNGSQKRGPQLRAQEIKLNNFRFNMCNPFNDSTYRDKNVINFADLSLSNIDVDLKSFSITNDSLSASISKIKFNEKSGFSILDFSGDAKVNSDGIEIKNLLIDDGNSEVNASCFSMKYSSIKDFSDFLRKVNLEADFINTFIDFNTISYFAPGLTDNKLSFYLTGKVKGTISDLRTDSLNVISETGLTNALINAQMAGLPDSDSTILNVDVLYSSTTSKDLSRIISSLNSSKPISLLENLSPLVRYSFTGKFKGFFNDFNVNGNLSSNTGDLFADVKVKTAGSAGYLELNGNLKSDNLDIGTILKEPLLGRLSVNTGLRARFKDQKSGGNEFRIDSLFIREFEFNRYKYRNISATGSYLKNIFDGKVICRDPNLDFIFQGIIGSGVNNKSYYDFYADLIYADLAALKLDKRDSLSAVSFKTLANFTRSGRGDIEGTINVRGLNFTNSKGKFPIGDISVQSTTGQDKFNVYLRSAFANASFRGDDFVTNFVDKLLDITIFKNLDAVFHREKQSVYSGNGKAYSMNVEFNDTKAVSQMVLPGLNISAGTTIRAEINENDNFNIEINSRNIGFGKTYANNLQMNISGNYDEMGSSLKSDLLHLSGFNLEGSMLFLKLKDNLLKINSEYSNKGELENKLDFSSEVLFTSLGNKRDYITDISIDSSEIFLNGERWKFAKSKIVKQDSTVVFHDFKLFRSDQYLNIDGIISTNPLDTLSVVLKDLDINPLNSFMPENLKLAGVFTGSATFLNLYKSPQIILNAKGKAVSVNDRDAGEFSISSEWDNVIKSFNFNINNLINGNDAISVRGYFRPDDDYLNTSIKLKNFSLVYFEPFLKEIISDFGGGVNGTINVDGPLKKLRINGINTTLDNLSFKVDYTNVGYTLNGPFTFRENGVIFNNIAIRDRAGNSGRVTGGLDHKYFNNLNLNILLNFINLEALNTKEYDNTDFYGLAYGTGRVSITGPLSKILIDVSVSANKNTAIHIPLSSSGDVSTKNLLTFIDPKAADSSNKENETETVKKAPGTELIVKLRANMTPEAAMLIEIDKSVGDVITGYGSGLITIDVNPLRDIFSITGDYIIQSGSYKFVLQGFIERDFTVQEGGNIAFSGDIMKTNLNLTANYRTKASINTLISDAESVSNKRNVDCQINMTGPLMNPNLKFSIDIPDLNPITKEKVNAALNTDDKIVKQVMSLLVSGSFIPDVQSSIVNNSTLLYSNATEVLSNQINKIFNQLDIPLDLSFNYQPGQNGRDLFDAAVSAQLFNNRVVVNGNIGSSRYVNKSSEVVGDLDVEIKLDDKGRFRAKAFSHSADQYSNYLDNTQRNGVGLVYQEEFSSFRELLNSFIIGRKRKERLLQEGKMVRRPEEIPLQEQMEMF